MSKTKRRLVLLCMSIFASLPSLSKAEAEVVGKMAFFNEYECQAFDERGENIGILQSIDIPRNPDPAIRDYFRRVDLLDHDGKIVLTRIVRLETVQDVQPDQGEQFHTVDIFRTDNAGVEYHSFQFRDRKLWPFSSPSYHYKQELVFMFGERTVFGKKCWLF